MTPRPPAEDRAASDRVELERSARVEGWEWGEDIWDEVAFLQRWGGSAAIEERLREVSSVLSWWLRGRTHAGPEDLEAIAGLEAARDRLKWLFTTADLVERQLRDEGVELDPKTRTLKRVKPVGSDGRKESGARKGLLRSAIEAEFRRLVLEEEWPWSNTPEVREEVRRRLLDRFHHSLLGTHRNETVYTAINLMRDPREQPR